MPSPNNPNPAPNPAAGDKDAFKKCLQAVAGIPVEAAISQFGNGLTED